MSDQQPVGPGWYHAAGDPPGTQRYWDGELWQGAPQPVGPPPASSTYQPGGYTGQSYPESSQATMALVLSILGIVICGLLGPAGWYIANQELDGIRSGRRDPSNEGTAKAARIIGIIVTALIAVGILLLILVLGLGVAA